MARTTTIELTAAGIEKQQRMILGVSALQIVNTWLGLLLHGDRIEIRSLRIIG